MTKLWFSVVAAGAAATAVTPLQKVISMLEDMKAKGKDQIQKEKVMYSRYKQWCEDTEAEKTNAISDAKVEIGALQGTIADKQASAEANGQEMVRLQQEISAQEGDVKAADGVRAEERKNFEDLQLDYNESIRALGKAIKVLKAESKDVPQGGNKKEEEASFMQLLSKNLSKSESDRVNALVKQPQAGEAAGYESQSGGVIGMFEELKEKFEDELRDVQREEADKKFKHERFKQSTMDAISAATDEQNSADAQKQDAEQRAASAQADLAETQQGMAQDQSYLEETMNTCSLRAKDFETRQKIMSDEQDAISKAMEIIANPNVAGAAQKVRSSFLQLNSKLEQQVVGVPNKLAQFLQNQAKLTKSRALQFLANRAMADPFTKIRGLIEDMITKLMEEASEEEAHHGMCTTELSKNEKARKRYTHETNKLNNEIEGLTADVAQMKEKMKELTDKNEASASALAQAQEMRSEEKSENQAAIEEAKIGAEAVGQALTVLREFYASSGAAFLQNKQPEIFEGTNVKQGGASTGVIGMLEVIESDFIRTQSETTAEEAEADKELQKLKDETDDSAAVNTAEINHLRRKSTKGTKKLGELSDELETTGEKLDAAEQVFEQLKPTCMPPAQTYEERVAARAKEVDALKEALEMLQNEGV